MGIKISKYLAIVSMVSVIVGTVLFLWSYFLRVLYPLEYLPFILLLIMVLTLSVFFQGKESVEEKKIKRTSYVSIVSLVSIVLAIASLLCAVVIRLYVFLYVFYFFIGMTFILGTTSLMFLAFKDKILKGKAYSIIALLLAVPCAQFCAHVLASRIYSEQYTSRSNIRRLYIALNEFAKANEGLFPSADRWSDLLIEYDKTLSNENFKHPLIKDHECNFAFNNNISALRLEDIPGDVVLLFEADGEWNLNGGAELLKERKFLRTYVLLANGKIYRYSFAEGGIIKGWDSKLNQSIIELPRWKP